MNYHQKLLDPRWQKLRLEVFERDGWKCVSCGNKDDTLHVHHKCYHPEPWDSPADELATLCASCHENFEAAIKMVREHPEVRALPYIVARALMLQEEGASWPESLLKCAISLCDLAEKKKKERAAEAAAWEPEAA